MEDLKDPSISESLNLGVFSKASSTPPNHVPLQQILKISIYFKLFNLFKQAQMEGVLCIRPRGSDYRKMLIARTDHGAADSKPVRHRSRTNYVICGAPCKRDMGIPC